MIERNAEFEKQLKKLGELKNASDKNVNGNNANIRYRALIR